MTKQDDRPYRCFPRKQNKTMMMKTKKTDLINKAVEEDEDNDQNETYHPLP
jgi:hypothetical protein